MRTDWPADSSVPSTEMLETWKTEMEKHTAVYYRTSDYVMKQAVDKGNGIMVALRLPPGAADVLSLEGGQPPESLHITLAYLGKASDFTPAKLETLRDVIADVARTSRPVETMVRGYGVFAETDDGPCLYAKVDTSQSLLDLHETVVEAVSSYGMPPTGRGAAKYVPHITLAYVESAPPPDVPPISDLSLSELTVTLGDTEETFPLGATKFEGAIAGKPELERDEDTKQENFLKAYDESQHPRGQGGQWTSGGGGFSGGARPPISEGLKERLAGTAVADADGPVRVYHGTSVAFEDFDPAKVNPSSSLGPGFYFTTNPNRAAAHSGGNEPNIRPAYLNIKRPIDVADSIPEEDAKKVVSEVMRIAGERRAADVYADIVTRPKGMLTGRQLLSRVGSYSWGYKALQGAGYDGVREKGAPNYGDTWVAWEPAQAHSAFAKDETSRPGDGGSLNPIDVHGGRAFVLAPGKTPRVNPYESLMKAGNAVAIDFDGTLTLGKDEENPAMRELVDTLTERGVRVVIFSARPAVEIFEWLVEHNWPRLEVTNVKSPDFKVYLDDRAVTFTPDMSADGLAEVLTTFEPWWAEVAKAFDESKHPRDPKGSGSGGQFTSGGGSGGGTGSSGADDKPEAEERAPEAREHALYKPGKGWKLRYTGGTSAKNLKEGDTVEVVGVTGFSVGTNTIMYRVRTEDGRMGVIPERVLTPADGSAPPVREKPLPPPAPKPAPKPGPEPGPVPGPQPPPGPEPAPAPTPKPRPGKLPTSPTNDPRIHARYAGKTHKEIATALAARTGAIVKFESKAGGARPWDKVPGDLDPVRTVPAHVAARMATEYDRLAEKYGISKGDYFGVDRMQFHHPWSNNAYAAAWHSGIKFNPSHWKNADKLTKSLQWDSQNGFHPVGCDDYESAVAHEYGHRVHQTLENAHHFGGDPGEWREFSRKFQWSAGPVSRYAEKNLREKFAEAFAHIEAIESGRWKGEMHPGAMMLNEFLKKKGKIKK